MELLLLFLFAGVAALFWSNRSLSARIDRLEATLSSGADTTQPSAAPRPSEPIVYAPQPPEPEPEPGAPRPGLFDRLAGLYEDFVGGRLLIWIGGVALAVAGVFLIRHSIEIGLVTPEMRMIAAALFGLLLVAAGEYARSGRLADDPRVAQALVGAGIAILYGTAYASHGLYELIGIGTASAAMLAISFAALLLALRHGAPTAVMGLAGGFLTPLLVGDPDAGALPLLSYVALLNLVIFAVAWRRGWTWLAAAGVALSFLWTGFLVTQDAPDALAAGVFILALAVTASFARPGGGPQLAMIQPVAIGLLELAVLVARLDPGLGLPAWILFGLLSAAALVLSLLRPEYRLAPAFALALALTLLLAKANTGRDPLVPTVAAAITILFAGFAAPLALRGDRLLRTAIACAAAAGPLLVLRAARPDLLDPSPWGALAAALALVPILLGWLLHGREGDGRALALCGAAAALLLGLAAFDLLPPALVAAAWAAIAIGLAWASRTARALAPVAGAAAAAAAVRAVASVPELWLTALLSLGGVPALASELPAAADAFQALLLPALLLFLLWRQAPAEARRPRRFAFAAAMLLALAGAYVLLKQMFGLSSATDFVERGMAERTLANQALFLAGWLICSGRLPLRGVSEGRRRQIGIALTAFAAARLVWFDLLIHNPALADQNVGRMPLANLIAPAYLLAAFWLYKARRGADNVARSSIWLWLFLAALVGGVMLMVRQLFHGPILTAPHVLSGESYGYSLAGLLVSTVLLVCGVRLPDKALRFAGLALLTATIVKVFLIDAAALTGLLRILSFLGLGIALIGIGRLYGTVLKAERREARPAA